MPRIGTSLDTWLQYSVCELRLSSDDPKLEVSGFVADSASGRARPRLRLIEPLM